MQKKTTSGGGAKQSSFGMTVEITFLKLVHTMLIPSSMTIHSLAARNHKVYLKINRARLGGLKGQQMHQHYQAFLSMHMIVEQVLLATSCCWSI
jgi:hypothetical protein